MGCGTIGLIPYHWFEASVFVYPISLGVHVVNKDLTRLDGPVIFRNGWLQIVALHCDRRAYMLQFLGR